MHCAVLPDPGRSAACIATHSPSPHSGTAGAAFSAVVAMPVGTMQDAGMLTTEDGALAYSAALAACRRAVSARLSGQGQAWAQSEAPINLYLPR